MNQPSSQWPGGESGQVPGSEEPWSEPRQLKISGLAIASLVAGFLGFFCAGVPSILGVILSLLAIRATSGATPSRRGQGLAFAGLAVSGFATIVGVLIAIGLGAFTGIIVGAVNTSTTMESAVKALHSYADDNDGFLPPADQWQKAAMEYDAELDLTVFGVNGKNAIVMNIAAAGQPVDSLDHDMVLLFEGVPGSPPAAGQAQMVKNQLLHPVAYVNGNTEAHPTDKLGTLKWTPTPPGGGPNTPGGKKSGKKKPALRSTESTDETSE